MSSCALNPAIAAFRVLQPLPLWAPGPATDEPIPFSTSMEDRPGARTGLRQQVNPSQSIYSGPPIDRNGVQHIFSGAFPTDLGVSLYINIEISAFCHQFQAKGHGTAPKRLNLCMFTHMQHIGRWSGFGNPHRFFIPGSSLPRKCIREILKTRTAWLIQRLRSRQSDRRTYTCCIYSYSLILINLHYNPT